MPLTLDIGTLKRLAKEKDEKVVYNALKEFNQQLTTRKTFEDVDYFVREEIVHLFEAQKQVPELIPLLLEFLRILARDANKLEKLLSPSIIQFVLEQSGLKATDDIQIKNVIESVMCLINTLAHSPTMREHFEGDCALALSRRLSRHLTSDFSGEGEWMNGIPKDIRDQLWFFDLRITFMITVYSIPVRRIFQTGVPLRTLSQTVEYLLEVEKNVEGNEGEKAAALTRANEVLKIMFNAFCKADPTEESTLMLTTMLNRLLRSNSPSLPAMEQNAVNILSCLPARPDFICPLIGEGQRCAVEYEGYDMTVIQLLLNFMEKRMDRMSSYRSGSQEERTEAECLGTYLHLFIQLCTESKQARRYCRLQIIPPLRVSDVERRPDEGNALRNKIIRVMTSLANSKDLAAQFLFVLCKKSVNRLIKYSGLGHAAGLLANNGLLGQVNSQRRDSDSEDSELEEYKEIENQVNPVTGCLPHEPKAPNPLDSMSEEQKEYEIDKLMNAVNKLMNTGVIKPGRIGADGRLEEVQHVLELAKDVPDPVNSDSDSD